MIRHPDRLLAVAHRSGNSMAGMREALDAGVDLVEADVHLHRSVLEMRHAKTLGRAHLWETWELHRRADVELLELAELVAGTGAEPRLMLDLKGVHRGLAPRVTSVLLAHDPSAAFVVCTKHWWMLETFPDPVRRVLSASNRPALARLRRRLARRAEHGVSVHLRMLTPEVVAELRSRTDVVMTWPVDSTAALAQARAVGADAVISKDLDLLRDVVAGRR